MKKLTRFVLGFIVPYLLLCFVFQYLFTAILKPTAFALFVIGVVVTLIAHLVFRTYLLSSYDKLEVKKYREVREIVKESGSSNLLILYTLFPPLVSSWFSKEDSIEEVKDKSKSLAFMFASTFANASYISLFPLTYFSLTGDWAGKLVVILFAILNIVLIKFTNFYITLGNSEGEAVRSPLQVVMADFMEQEEIDLNKGGEVEVGRERGESTD